MRKVKTEEVMVDVANVDVVGISTTVTTMKKERAQQEIVEKDI